MDPKEWTNIIEKVAHITSGEGSAVSPQSSHSGKKPDNPNKVRQAVYDIRYKARTEDVPLETAFSQYIGRSGLGSQEKEEVKKKLFGEEVVNEVLSPAEADTLRRKREQQKRNRVVKQRAAQKSLENDDQKLRDIAARMRADEYDPTLDEEKAKYKVRVQDKSGKKHYKMLDRNKIADARRDPDVSSVEMTKYGKLDAVGKEDGDVNNDGKKDSQDSYLLNRRKAIGKAMKKEGLDPVGKEDGDVNNDGKKDGTDKYLLNRRKKIGDAIKNASKMKEEKDYSDKEKVMQKAKPLHKHLYKNLHKGDKDGDVNEGLKPRIARQPLSSWRNDLVEVIGEKEPGEKKFDIKKGIKNKVVINPKLGESIEELGGTLMEVIEFDEFEYMIEGVYDELLEEGYDEDLIEDAIEYALTEATVTVGHDTEGPKAERTRDKLKKSAKSFIGKMAYKGYHAARKAKRAAEPAMQRAKTSAKRGVRKMALKVADKLKEENVDEASYTPGNEKPFPYGKVGDKLRKVAGERDAEKDPKKRNKLASRVSKMNREYNLPEAVYGGTPPEKKDTRMTVTNADKKANTPAYQKYKAGDKRYKAADHMGEGYGAPGHNPGSGEKSVARAKALMDKQGRKGAPGLNAMMAAKKEHEARRGVKKEEVEVAEADSLAAMQARREKRLAAQRKREGTTASGRDFGHDYSLTPAQQKARRDAEFKAGIGTKKEEVEQVDEVNRAAMGRINKEYHRKKEAEAMAARKRDPKVKRDLPKRKNDNPMYDAKSAGSSRVKDFKFTGEEVEHVDEAMRPGERQRKMRAKMHDPYVKGGSKTRGQAHNIAVRGDVSTGDPAIKSRGGGGVKKDKGMGYGDRGAGNKARRRAGQEPMRGNRDPRNEGYAPGDVDQKLKTDRNMFTISKKDQEAAKQRLLAKAKAKQVKEGDGDPCWDSHKQVGMKKKGGRMVPNCVPKNEELSIDQQMKISRDHNRKSPEEKKAANRKALGVVKKVKREKDTRTDSQKMADAYASPRKGPGGATRAD